MRSGHSCHKRVEAVLDSLSNIRHTKLHKHIDENQHLQSTRGNDFHIHTVPFFFMSTIQFQILVPLTFVENFSGNRLIDKVKEHFPRIKYTGCPRSTFNKTNGMDILSNLCIPSLNAILLVLEHRYVVIAECFLYLVAVTILYGIVSS